MKTIVWLLIVFGIVSIVKPSPGSMAKRRCGSVLEDVLSGLCKTYSEPDFRKKKSDNMAGPLYQDYENGVTLNQLYDMYLETVMVRPTFRHGRVRRQSGIVEECCLNPCSIETLLLYCSN